MPGHDGILWTAERLSEIFIAVASPGPEKNTCIIEEETLEGLGEKMRRTLEAIAAKIEDAGQDVLRAQITGTPNRYPPQILQKKHISYAYRHSSLPFPDDCAYIPYTYLRPQSLAVTNSLKTFVSQLPPSRVQKIFPALDCS